MQPTQPLLYISTVLHAQHNRVLVTLVCLTMGVAMDQFLLCRTPLKINRSRIYSRVVVSVQKVWGDLLITISYPHILHLSAKLGMLFIHKILDARRARCYNVGRFFRGCGNSEAVGHSPKNKKTRRVLRLAVGHSSRFSNRVFYYPFSPMGIGCVSL